MDRRALLKDSIARFARERKWGKYHTPKNLAMAMVKEAAEVVEIFQWLTPAQARRLSSAQRAHLGEELADTFVYLVKIADCFGIDLTEAALSKMEKNRLKYPVARNRGKISKPRRR
ncbi:MAG: nucleotide pyrophosphohydrolase [Elusimicrobia bacterium RBG_16_66_12]|nr:MAG: nucleotide pyrophosphohydrolase [Elusimicrobia bacterium RBG_16_66_12]